MATNLRAKLPSSDKLIIHDLNLEVTAKFKSDNQNVEVAQTVREVAEQSVSTIALPSSPISAP